MTATPPLSRLIEIMAALRTPGTGCPWDLQQTFETIAPYTIEEAYEVADAIERGDLADLKDELGDLLLQVVYHSRMAEEQGAFAFDHVAEAVARKMIRRHPHVFGTPEERAAGAAPGFWEKLKAEEKAEKARERALTTPSPRMRGEGNTSLLDDTPVGLPALTRAIKLQNKAARVGFDWPSLAPVFDKMREELAELEEVARPSAAAALTPERQSKIEEEFGDLLFVMANVARHMDIDPEAALRSANTKFTRRFQHIEKRLAEQGSSPSQSSLEDMDALWDEAKEIEKRTKDL
jgi:nucleoside triphosphate diphosphatase